MPDSSLRYLAPGTRCPVPERCKVCPMSLLDEFIWYPDYQDQFAAEA